MTIETFLGTPMGHLGFAVGAMGFAVRDIVWLRLISIVSSVALITYTINVHEHVWVAVSWQTVFIIVNGSRLFQLIYGERAARFDEHEQELYDTMFRGFTRLEFMRLMRIADWRTAEPGDVLTTEGAAVPELLLITCGAADVIVGDRPVAELRSGQLVGEMSLMTGEMASATVRVREATRYIAWSKASLARLLNRNPSMHFVMDSVLGIDLSRKLKDTRRETGPDGAPASPAR